MEKGEPCEALAIAAVAKPYSSIGS